MKKGLIALTLCLTGLGLGQAHAQLVRRIALTPAPAITINGQSNSVFSQSLRGGNGLASTGQVAYPQSFPAAVAQQVPTVVVVTSPVILAPGSTLTVNAPTSVFTPTTPAVSDYSCATARPDFRYNANKLAFDRQSTATLGQVDMNFWSGLPPGTNRYVPLGEF